FQRKENDALLRGQATFVADISLPGMLHAAFLRSIHAHAIIRRIDASRALELPGVIAVFDGHQVHAAMGRRLPQAVPHPLLAKYTEWPMIWHHVRDIAEPGAVPAGRPGESDELLTGNKVRYVGETIALVVAESRRGAED